MNEIASAAQLDALPVRSIGIDEDGDAWQKFDDGWRAAFCDPTAEPNPSEVPPLTVLYRPDEPQRVQPSREDVAATLAPIEAIHQRVPLHNPEDECECGDRDAHEIGYSEDGEPVCLTEEPICWICAECYHDDGGLDDPMEWPCPTAQAIADIKAKAGA